MKDKRLHKFIAITLCVTLLTISASRVTRVSAIGTTTAIAGAAFIATGLVYMSYLALTGAEIRMPIAQDLRGWLSDVGTKVSQYPSGSKTYEELYQYYAVQRDPLAVVIDGVWTWTEDKLKSFINDFSDTRIIEDITGYYEHQDITYIPTNGFNYQNLHILNETVNSQPFSYYAAQGYTILPMGDIIAVNRSDYQGSSILYPAYSNLQGEWRNLLKINGKYSIQHLVNGSWVTDRPYYALGFTATKPNENSAFYPFPGQLAYYKSSYWNGASGQVLVEYDWPLLQNRVIHDEATDEDLPMVIPESEVFYAPQWTDPDNNNRPIVPWVPIPNLPSGVTPPSGYNNIDQWGFNLEDLLDILSDLGEAIFDLSALKELINAFAGQHGDEYYLYYDDGNDNYYYFYQPTNYNGDYVTYNIDVSDTYEHLPVDLNTIELYTKNRYLDEVKRSAIAGSSIIRDLVVFWYDVDPTIIYIVFGSCIAILVAAFIGKWGHS